MTTRFLDYGIFSVTLPESWDEMSYENGELYSPLTFANDETGVGALQISIAKYGNRSHIGEQRRCWLSVEVSR